MKIKIAFFIILVIVGATSCFSATPNGSVAILYNKKSKPNKKALQFMGKELKKIEANYSFKSYNDPDKVIPGENRAIIILNTGQKSGIDPFFSEFIESWSNKSELILVTLIKGSKDYSVKLIPMNENLYGVDAITSSSIWNGATKGMHSLWVKNTIDIIDGRP